MATVFCAKTCDRFIEIKSNFIRRKKLHEGSNFLGGSFSNRDNVRALIQFKRDDPSILKDDFSSRTDPSIFPKMAPELLHQSNKTSLVFRVFKSTATSWPCVNVYIAKCMLDFEILLHSVLVLDKSPNICTCLNSITPSVNANFAK